MSEPPPPPSASPPHFSPQDARFNNTSSGGGGGSGLRRGGSQQFRGSSMSGSRRGGGGGAGYHHGGQQQHNAGTGFRNTQHEFRGSAGPHQHPPPPHLDQQQHPQPFQGGVPPGPALMRRSALGNPLPNAVSSPPTPIAPLSSASSSSQPGEPHVTSPTRAAAPPPRVMGGVAAALANRRGVVPTPSSSSTIVTPPHDPPPKVASGNDVKEAAHNSPNLKPIPVPSLAPSIVNTKPPPPPRPMLDVRTPTIQQPIPPPPPLSHNAPPPPQLKSWQDDVDETSEPSGANSILGGGSGGGTGVSSKTDADHIARLETLSNTQKKQIADLTKQLKDVKKVADQSTTTTKTLQEALDKKSTELIIAQATTKNFTGVRADLEAKVSTLEKELRVERKKQSGGGDAGSSSIIVGGVATAMAATATSAAMRELESQFTQAKTRIGELETKLEIMRAEMEFKDLRIQNLEEDLAEKERLFAELGSGGGGNGIDLAPVSMDVWVYSTNDSPSIALNTLGFSQLETIMVDGTTWSGDWRGELAESVARIVLQRCGIDLRHLGGDLQALLGHGRDAMVEHHNDPQTRLLIHVSGVDGDSEPLRFLISWLGEVRSMVSADICVVLEGFQGQEVGSEDATGSGYQVARFYNVAPLSSVVLGESELS